MARELAGNLLRASRRLRFAFEVLHLLRIGIHHLERLRQLLQVVVVQQLRLLQFKLRLLLLQLLLLLPRDSAT